MKFKLVRKSLVGLIIVAFCLVSSANANIITGPQTTDGGKVVNLQGLEWLSLNQTVGQSRLDVEAGFTAANGDVWAKDEWQYATRLQTSTLLSSLWGQISSGWSEDNFDGASWFLENFAAGLGLTSPEMSVSFFYGEGSCGAGESCYGTVSVSQDSNLFGAATSVNGRNVQATVSTSEFGNFMNGHGLNDCGGGDGSYIDRDGNTVVIADPCASELVETLGLSLLVRAPNILQFVEANAVQASEPSTISFFALALMGIGFRRFKR